MKEEGRDDGLPGSEPSSPRGWESTKGRSRGTDVGYERVTD